MADSPAKKSQKRYELRDKTIKLRGGKCVWCGIDNPLVLQLDHIHGDGCMRQLASGKRRSTIEMLRMTWRDGGEALVKDTYQVLCANCHVIKTRQNKDHLPRDRRP